MFVPVPPTFMPTEGRRMRKALRPRLRDDVPERRLSAVFSGLVAVLTGGGGGGGGVGGVGIFGVDKHMIIQFFC